MPAPTASTPYRDPSQEAFARALKRHLGDAPASSPRITAGEVRRGVSFERVEQFRKKLGLTQETLTRVLGMSERTLLRRKESSRFTPVESDRFGRLLRIWQLSLRAFDDHPDEARHWLTTPKRAFDGEAPVEQLDTEPGTRAVEEMLLMIDQTIPV